ncbi:MAG TPA: preprotein translocase subunit YajC [bacterium]
MSTAIVSVASAWAQQAAGAPQQQGPGGLVGFLLGPFGMMIIIFAIIYLLIMRPQQKKQKQQQEMLRNLQRGDKVLTQAGIYGTIVELNEKAVVLQVDDEKRVRLKISRWSVADKVTEDIGV